MRLEQLQSFLNVAETGSFQQAARQCGVTQSTISRQIQALETEVGLPLFHRSTQAKLTVGGERLWPYARKICQAWQNAQVELEDLLAGKQPELCVAAVHSICSSYLPPVLQRFCRVYPDIQLRVTSLGSDRALKVLKDGLVDIAIVMNNSNLTTNSELLVDVLYEESIEVLMAQDHPLSRYTQVPWTELVRYPQVVFKEGYGMRRLLQEQFIQAGVPLKAALELNTLDAFRGVVRQGELIALLPHSALIETQTDSTLTIRAIAPFTHSANRNSSNGLNATSSLTREVVVATTSDRMQIPPLEYFWKLVHQYIPPELDVGFETINPRRLIS
ncbi:MAG: LysR family transcriptional regulator [Microcoleaceae cyanobacterium]